MLLVADQDILPEQSDSIGYAATGLHYLQGGHDDRFPNHLPGLPLMARGTMQLGIPYKLFLDGLFSLTVIWVACQLWRWFASRWLALCLAIALLLSPWFINQSMVFMTEPIVSIFLLGAMTSALAWLLNPPDRWQWRWAVAPTIFSSLVVVFRPEWLLMALFWLAIIVWVVVVHWRTWWRLNRRQLGWAAGTLLAPWLAIFAANYSLAVIHYFHYGVMATHPGDASGLSSLLNALYKIEPKEKIRFVPVTRQSLADACAVSPTLNRYRDSLLDVKRVNFQQAQASLGITDEVGTWLNWHLLDCLGGLTPSTDGTMRQAASEIQLAMATLRLPRRPAVFPIDPMQSAWQPEVPGLLWKSITAGCFPNLDYPNAPELLSNLGQINPADLVAFNRLLLPRRGTTSDVATKIFGFTMAQDSRVEQVRLVTDAGAVVAQASVNPASPHCKFVLTMTGLPATGSAVFLEFLGKTGVKDPAGRVFISFADEAIETEVFFRRDDGTVGELWSMSIDQPLMNFPHRQRFRKVLVSNYHWGLLGLGLVCLVSGIVNRPDPQHGWLLLAQWSAWIAISALFWGRTIMYALLEAWTHWGLERYVGPHQLLFVTLSLLAAHLAGRTLRQFWERLKAKG